MVNPLIFVDLPTPDPEATSQFYETLFDWKYKRRPAGEFHEVLPGVKPNLGIHLETTPVTGPVPRIYVMVYDPPEKLAAAIEMGATKMWDEFYWEEFDARHAAFRGAMRWCCGATRAPTCPARPRRRTPESRSVRKSKIVEIATVLESATSRL